MSPRKSYVIIRVQAAIVFNKWVLNEMIRIYKNESIDYRLNNLSFEIASNQTCDMVPE